jgi:hypothetical protein
MCSDKIRLISDLSEADIRETLQEGDKGGPVDWMSVLNVADAGGVTDVMALLDRQVEGSNSDGFTPGDVGRALERELRILLCSNDPKYKDVRSEMSKTKRTAREVGIGVASAIAGAWHLQAAVLTPFVLVFLLAAIRVGVGAWCAGKPLESAPKGHASRE